jgi:hypothetical protein
VPVDIIRRDKGRGALELEQVSFKNSNSTIAKNIFLKVIKRTNRSLSKWCNSIEIVPVDIIRREKGRGVLKLGQVSFKSLNSTIAKNNFLKMIK